MNSKITAATLLFMASVQTTFGQEFHANLTTEIETDFHDKNDWVNQLRLDFSMPLSKHVFIDAATYSVAQTREEGVADDYQTFSNIYADNMTLALAVAGVRWETGKTMFFFGVRNVGEDYFTSDVTSLFTNSSCGIYPTIAMSTDPANYPLAGMGVHYAYTSERWEARASVYNGAGHKHFTGRDNVFRVCPKTDGVFVIASANYNHNDGSQYFIGGSFYRGKVHPGTPDDSETDDKRYSHAALWCSAEQRLTQTVKLMLQYSGSITHGAACRSYVGAGAVKAIKKVECGLFTDYALFSYGKEWATEATAKIHINDKSFLQPALHFIRTDGDTSFVGLLRFGYGI